MRPPEKQGTREAALLNSSPQRIGENIRRARRVAGWTQEELAEKIEVSGPYVSMLENGENDASMDVYRKLAAAFGMPLSELFKTIAPGAKKTLGRFIESSRDDGDIITDVEEEFLLWVSIPGRRMTNQAYTHALAMFRASRSDDED